MKTVSQIKFDKIIKEWFYEILQWLNFKKKTNNFYLKIGTITQVINVQKSRHWDKNNINFTINIGILIPEYWLSYYNYDNKKLPDYPSESECLIRERIGGLNGKGDTWYEVTHQINETALIIEMKNNLIKFIIPYLNKFNSIEKILLKLDSKELWLTDLEQMIVYSEFRKFDKAKLLYKKLLKNKTHTYQLMKTKEYGQKYNLDE